MKRHGKLNDFLPRAMGNFWLGRVPKASLTNYGLSLDTSSPARLRYDASRGNDKFQRQSVSSNGHASCYLNSLRGGIVVITFASVRVTFHRKEAQ